MPSHCPSSGACAKGAATGQPASAYIEPVASNAPRRNFGHCSSSIPTGTIVAPPAETDQGEIAALGEASRGPLLLSCVRAATLASRSLSPMNEIQAFGGARSEPFPLPHPSICLASGSLSPSSHSTFSRNTERRSGCAPAHPGAVVGAAVSRLKHKRLASRVRRSPRRKVATVYPKEDD